MILKAGKAESLENAVSVLEDAIANGSAFAKFLEWIEAQGGDPDQALHPETLPMAEILHPVLAVDEGFVTKIDTENVGKTSLILGGGRETKESMIDLSVGLVLQKKVGDTVAKGDVLAMIHGNDADKVNKAEKMLLEAYHISKNRPEKTALIKCIVS
jgi:pyrimidine-nucleoside phosphorylase